MEEAETQQPSPSQPSDADPAPDPTANPTADPAADPSTLTTAPSARRRGRPFRRSHPYYIGFVGGLGVIICFYLAESLLVVTTELILILIALLIAVGLNPLVEKLTTRGMRRGLAVLIVAGGGLLLLAAFITAIAQPLATQTSGLIDAMPKRLENLERNRTIANLDQR